MSDQNIKNALEALIQNYSDTNLYKFLELKTEHIRKKEDDFTNRVDRDFLHSLNQIGEIELDNEKKMFVITGEMKKELNERTGKKKQYDVAKEILKSNNSYDGGIFVFYDKDGSFRFSLIFKEYLGVKVDVSTFKRYTYYICKEFTNKTFIEQMINAEFTSLLNIKEAFSVEKLGDEFYKTYSILFSELLESVLTKLENNENKNKVAKQIVHQFFNRLMFLFFIQKKYEWFESEPNFVKMLLNEYKIYKNNNKKSNFYRDYLKIIFLEAFNKDYSKRSYYSDKLHKILQLAPFLNGGLFKRNEYDEYIDELSDEIIIDKIIIEFLMRFNFTIDETSINDRELSINPELIGTIYERFVNVETKSIEESEGHSKGIVYTHEEEINFMCRMSILHYLLENMKDADSKLIFDLVFDDYETFECLKCEPLSQIKNVLDNIKIVDPACGSGSFLVGMMNLLMELKKKVLKSDPKENINEFGIKIDIIKNNLHGVDVQEWALKIAELRLWLSLIVESDIKREKIQSKPLLPSLSFKLRQGDSIVEGLDNNELINKKIKEIMNIKKIKSQVQDLFNRKSDYLENKRTITKEMIEKMEQDIYISIINDRINDVTKRLAREKRNVSGVQQHLYDNTEQKELSLNTPENDNKKLKLEMEELIEFKRQFIKSTKPFIWQVDFAEIFFDEDKKGFDIVIGNPPYVRQEEIAPPLEKEKGQTESSWREIKKNYKIRLQEVIVDLYGEKYKPSGHADLYVYFYLKSLSLINDTGVFCFITSNSWLDVEFGKALQEFLLKRTNIYGIYDNKKRSFSQADINTIIIVTSNPKSASKEKEILSNIARFVMFSEDYGKVTNKETIKELIKEDKLKNNNSKIYSNIVQMNEYRMTMVKQNDLYNDSLEKNDENQNYSYQANKWAGKLLRAPDIYYKILEKGKDKLKKLGDITEIKFGIKSGANEFFYLSVDRIKELKIESEFLFPVFKSPKESDSILINQNKLNYKIIICNKSKKELAGTYMLEYIKWGEKQKYHERPTCMQREKWWSIEKHYANYFLQMTFDKAYKIFYSNNPLLCDARFGVIQRD